MTGIEAGKTWSRIGAEVAPTSSAASGVWGSLNEVSGYVGAGTWPAPVEAWEHIVTVEPTSGRSVTLTSIPSTYHHLVMRTNIIINDASATALGFNTTLPTSTDCWSLINETDAAQVPAKQLSQVNYMSYNPFARPTGDPYVEEVWIYDYATTGMATIVERRAGSNGSTTASEQAFGYAVQYPNYIGTTAVSSLTYYFYTTLSTFQTGSVIDLYGVGEAI